MWSCFDMESIQVEPADQGVAVRLIGEVTLAEAAALKERLLEALDAAAVLIDCRQLQTVDVAVLQLLLAARRSAAEHHKTFQIVDSPDSTLAACCAAVGLQSPGEWK
jgi:anti-anti-sigma regulatory factor